MSSKLESDVCYRVYSFRHLVKATEITFLRIMDCASGGKVCYLRNGLFTLCSQVNSASLQTLMRPSYLYTQHPHHYQHHHQQPAHQLTRPTGTLTTHRLSVEALGTQPANPGSGTPVSRTLESGIPGPRNLGSGPGSENPVSGTLRCRTPEFGTPVSGTIGSRIPGPRCPGSWNPVSGPFGSGTPGSGTPSGLIDLSCSAPRFQHHYQTSASDVSGKAYRGGKCPTTTQLGLHQREEMTDLRLMIPTVSPTQPPQVNC